MQQFELRITLTVFFFAVCRCGICADNVQLPVSTGEFYQVHVVTHSNHPPSLVEVTVLPRGDVHCNIEYPWTLSLVSSENVQISKTKFNQSDARVFSADRVVFDIPFSAWKKKATAHFILKLSMCNSTQCFMKKVPIDLTL